MANEKRLIDANALDEAIRTDFWEHFTQCHDTDQTALIDMVCEDIGNAPTVDAMEVVHGRWLPVMEEFDGYPSIGIRGGVFQTGWKCSICGRSELVKEPYCNCGAKMDGD